jgi:hypothetical protein
MMRTLVIAVGAVACLFGTTARALAADDCNRGCLRTMLDQYLTAVTTHNPSAAPLFAGFRQTENAVVVRLGNGVWKTVTALGNVQRRYLDAVSGQAAYYGIVEEGSTSAVVTVRIRVQDRAITEAEWYIARSGDPGLNGPPQPGQPPPNLFNPEGLIANPPPERVVPKAARASRELLIAIANSYFDGLTTHDGTIIMAHPGCVRIENGTNMMTGRGGRGGARGNATGAAPAAPNDCTSGLVNFNASIVGGRRFPVADEEAGVVLGLAVFIRRPGSPVRRNAFSEWFFVDDGKIRTIYTAMFYPPSDLPVPNWPPYDGNWPVPAFSPTPQP